MCNKRVRPPANECMTDWLRNWEAPVLSLGLNTECGILCGSQLFTRKAQLRCLCRDCLRTKSEGGVLENSAAEGAR